MALLNVKRWEEYRDFFQLWFIRYFIAWFSLVPLIYQVLSDLPDRIEISLEWTKRAVPGIVFDPPTPLVLNLTLPFTWQLLWMASLLFFAAFLIYQLKCPMFVKKYNKYSDYLSYGHDPRHLAWEVSYLFEHPDVEKDKFVDRLEIKKYIARTDQIFDTNKVEIRQNTTSFYFYHNGVPYEFSAPVRHDAPAEIKDEAARGVFWEIFGRYSALDKAWRATIQSLLVSCWTIVAIVLAQYVWAGFKLFLIWFHDIAKLFSPVVG